MVMFTIMKKQRSNKINFDRKPWIYIYYNYLCSHPDDDAGFDLGVKIPKKYYYINEQSVKLAVNSVEKSLKKNFQKKY